MVRGQRSRFYGKRHESTKLPSICPIEQFWGIVKGKMSTNGGCAKDVNSMRQKWNKFAEKVTPELVREMMSGINRKVREFMRSSSDAK